MDISKVVRNAKKVRATLENVDEVQITKTGCVIYVPEDYTSKSLAFIGSEISVLGVYALFIDDKHYAVSKATAMQTLGDCGIDTVVINDVGYLKLTFEPGSVVIKNRNLITSKKLTNYIMGYFIDYGKAPWFFNQRDQAELFKYAGYFNDMNMGSMAIQDIIVAGVSRDPNNVKSYFRHADVKGDLLDMYPRFIPLRDIAMNTTSNLARINGSELNRGIRETLLSEPERVEGLEKLYIQ